jgi:hypothetical protein
MIKLIFMFFCEMDSSTKELQHSVAIRHKILQIRETGFTSRAPLFEKS